MNAELKNGSFILYNAQDIRGIEIHYTGSITINPTLPTGWVCRANKNKILIFNMSNEKLNSEQNLFTYTGTIKIRYAFGTADGRSKTYITISNPKRNWNNIYYRGADFTSLTENWDTIENKDKSNSKTGFTSIVNQQHIKETNKIFKVDKTIKRPSVSVSTSSSGGY
jgi:hypothetical protein